MDPFIGEIRMVGFSFAPNGWALCNGQLLSIQQNTARPRSTHTPPGRTGCRRNAAAGQWRRPIAFTA